MMPDRLAQCIRGLKSLDCTAGREERTLTSAKLFQLLNESIVLLLGALLILLALSGRVGLPARPAPLIVLGIVFIYWGVRAWVRREPERARWPSQIRAASLALVGVLILSIPVLPVRWIPLLLGLAGGVLVLRGALGTILFARGE
jgi:hypothetical protein